jgi:hypothetical protein
LSIAHRLKISSQIKLCCIRKPSVVQGESGAASIVFILAVTASSDVMMFYVSSAYFENIRRKMMNTKTETYRKTPIAVFRSIYHMHIDHPE